MILKVREISYEEKCEALIQYIEESNSYNNPLASEEYLLFNSAISILTKIKKQPATILSIKQENILNRAFKIIQIYG